MLNFCYKLFVGKHGTNIAIPIISPIDETSLGFDEEILDVSPLSGPVRSNILKSLIHEEKALQEVMATYTTRKNVCEGIIKTYCWIFFYLNILFLVLKKM